MYCCTLIVRVVFCIFSAAHKAKESDGEEEKTEKKKTDTKVPSNKKTEKTSGMSRTDEMHIICLVVICTVSVSLSLCRY